MVNNDFIALCKRSQLDKYDISVLVNVDRKVVAEWRKGTNEVPARVVAKIYEFIKYLES
jgi:hypothetical protein